MLWVLASSGYPPIEIRDFKEVIGKLADNAQFVYDGQIDGTNMFVGMFAYDSSIGRNHSLRILDELRIVANQHKRRVVNHISLGQSFFIRFWSSSPYRVSDYDKWHSYWLDRKAAGYFINNVVDLVAEESVSLNEDIWFPAEGKEGEKIDEMHL